MKITDFKTYEKNTFRNIQCYMEIKKKILSDKGRIRLVGQNHYEMLTKDGIYKFFIADNADEKLICDNIRQGKNNIAQAIMTSNDSNVFFLHVVFFHNTTHEGKWNIVLSDTVKNKINEKKLTRKGRIWEDEIKENFCLFDGNNFCFAYTIGKYDFSDENVNEKIPVQTGNYIESDNKKDFEKNNEEYINIKNTSINEDIKNIKIYGRDYSLLIRMQGSEGKEFLYAEKIDIHNNNIPSMILGIGELTFKDNETFISERVKKELEINSGYLDLWEQYTQLEGDFLLKKARAVGTFTIDKKNINRCSEGIIILPRGLSSKGRSLITNGDYLMFSEEEPIYIQDENMTWSEYKEYERNLRATNLPKKASQIMRIVRIDKDNYIVLDSKENDEVPNGIISLSIYGNLKQITRRETARELILNGESANPALGLIIEGKTQEGLIQLKNIKKIEALTAFVKNKIFKNEPTIAQRKAIEIALNTPDIAIIQGPPGTGKTTVITAIIERLNEIADKRRDNKGQVLVTSFQHDAVRNVIERLSINSLPTIKFGKKEKDDISMEKAIEDWCAIYSKKIKEKNPSIQLTLEEKELARLFNFYLVSPSDTNAIAFLSYAKKISLNNEIYFEIEKLIEEINIRNEEYSNNLIWKIHRIRTTKEAFKDDGAEAADTLLFDLEDIMDLDIDDNKFIFKILNQAADCTDSEPSQELLKNLSKIKRALLTKCLPKPSYKIEKPMDEILNIYRKLQKSLKKPKNELDEILFNLLNELENNTSEVEDSIASYNFVYAATTQQSEGNDIKRAKNIELNEHPTYDTVIIDEAARVNPGDLMIPMAQARRRIIFVGDHRQLPHIYDEEIFESMQQNDSSIDKNIVKISMFQYLMKKASELSKLDNIQRVITLDAQYRMHPLLGNFVSENFYDLYGEHFSSPRPASDFEQLLFDKPLVWIDLPSDCGKEEKKGTSRIRMCEADYIVDKVKGYIDSKEGKELSYGIITFYSAQVNLIQKKLGDLANRVRVGSVDAFQGMEFDVIFLSIVRSHKKEPIVDLELLNTNSSDLSEDDKIYNEYNNYKQKVGLSNYGFLTSENRLCVALSRQKKLLIVVGDSSIFYKGKWGNIAEKCVPGMKHLYELCKKEGIVINGKAESN